MGTMKKIARPKLTRRGVKWLKEIRQGIKHQTLQVPLDMWDWGQVMTYTQGGRKVHCATAACLAGELCLLSGAQFMPQYALWSGEKYITSQCRTLDGRKLYILDYARKLLYGTARSESMQNRIEWDAAELFNNFASPTKNYVWKGLDHTIPADQITAINRFLRAHGER